MHMHAAKREPRLSLLTLQISVVVFVILAWILWLAGLRGDFWLWCSVLFCVSFFLLTFCLFHVIYAAYAANKGKKQSLVVLVLLFVFSAGLGFALFQHQMAINIVVVYDGERNLALVALDDNVVIVEGMVLGKKAPPPGLSPGSFSVVHKVGHVFSWFTYQASIEWVGYGVVRVRALGRTLVYKKYRALLVDNKPVDLPPSGLVRSKEIVRVLADGSVKY